MSSHDWHDALLVQLEEQFTLRLQVDAGKNKTYEEHLKSVLLSCHSDSSKPVTVRMGPGVAAGGEDAPGTGKPEGAGQPGSEDSGSSGTVSKVVYDIPGVQVSKWQAVLYSDEPYRVRLENSGTADLEVLWEDGGELFFSVLSGKSDSRTFTLKDAAGFRTLVVRRKDSRNPLLRVELEFVPYKMDYRTDYRALVDDLVSRALGLVLMYGARTRQGFSLRLDSPDDDRTWLSILENIAEELEKALLWIAENPHRELTNVRELVRADRVRTAGPAVVREVARGRGVGDFQEVHLSDGSKVRVRRHLWVPVRKTTIDTPEHRWLSVQLRRIVARLRRLEQDATLTPDRYGSEKRQRLLEAIKAHTGTFTRLASTEPFNLEGPPPVNLNSMRFQNTPGYREAYRLLRLLDFVMKLVDTVKERFPMKRLSDLYEWWTVFAVFDCVREVIEDNLGDRAVGEIAGTGELLMKSMGILDSDTLSNSGLSVKLNDGTKVTLYRHRAYSPVKKSSDAKGYTIQSHKPDMAVEVQKGGKLASALIIDAKYRRERYGNTDKWIWGPPQDAINVLHRYRDVIATRYDLPRGSIWGLIVFPGDMKEENNYRQSLMVKGIIGDAGDAGNDGNDYSHYRIGAIPLLPVRDGQNADQENGNDTRPPCPSSLLREVIEAFLEAQGIIERESER